MTLAATRPYRSVNPVTGQILEEFNTLDQDQVECALTSAHRAYSNWRQTHLAERLSLLARFAALVETDYAGDLARTITLEMGKPIGQATAEVGLVSAICRYYIENAKELLADEEVRVPGVSHVVTRREPIGVVLGIEPWNSPLYQAIRVAVPNLVLGNTVLIKPAEITAGSTLKLDHIFDRAGFPAGAYRTVLIDVEQVSTLISDPRLRAVSLTGSDRAGAAVGAQTGKFIKPTVLELGGSDAFIVLDTANVSKAASTAANCRLKSVGQICGSPKRLIVTESVADDFVDEFVRAFTGYQMGDPLDPSTTVGPLSSTAAVDLLQDQMQDAIDKGARVLVEGGRSDAARAFFTPAVLTDVTPAMRLYHEEAFGPLAVIYRVADADAAVEVANDSVYGLGGTVFAEDLHEARRVAGALDTGAVGINMWLGGPIEIPFGGTKQSGIGRELGRYGMDQYANLKTYGTAAQIQS